MADKMRTIKNGALTYRTENSYSRLKEVKWVFGGGIIKTLTAGQVVQKGEIIFIEAEIQYTYYDEFTDPSSIRQLFFGHHLLADLPLNWPSALGVTISEVILGQMYPITGSWKTKLIGSIPVNKG